jgi:NADH-quinone oxidoreductase subunit L
METILILFAPLVGALICGFHLAADRRQAACVVATGCCSWPPAAELGRLPDGFDGETYTRSLFTWIESGTLFTDWAIRVDRLTAIMLIVSRPSRRSCTSIPSATWHDDDFKEGESYRPRFFAYLSFFTFAMLMLVTADNLLQLFFGWEGVGVASYLLIGFWYRKPSANAAAMKAFIVNRVGDFGFALGIFGALYWMADSIQFDVILRDGPRADGDDVPLPRLRGERGQHDLRCCCSSARWASRRSSAAHLAAGRDGGPDAGLRADPRRDHGDGGRLPGLPHVADHRIRATSHELHHHHRRDDGLLRGDGRPRAERHQARDRLFDLLAAGLHVRGGGRRRLSVAMFHLFTHAFFKAMLFLGAGSVIHAMHHEQDMRNYGRPAEEDPLHVLGDDDRHAGHHGRRHPYDLFRLRRLLLEGRGGRKRLAFGGDLGTSPSGR